MRILIYSLNYSPELTGIGKYSGEFARFLAERGNDVTVICAPPYYPQWQVNPPYRSWWYRVDNEDGITVIRCPLWVPASPSGLKRILHLASFALSSSPVLIASLVKGKDILFNAIPTLACTPQSLLLGWLTRTTNIGHIHDFEVDLAFGTGMIRYPGLYKFASRIESWLLKRFDVVTTISPKMLEKLHNKGVATNRTDLFPNWVDTTAIYPLEDNTAYRAELGLEAGTVVALYTGNMGEKQGLEIIIEAAQRLSGLENLVFILCGAGSSRERLQALAGNATNIKWLPLQPYEKLNKLLNTADVHLLPQKEQAEDLVLPSKLTGIFASGRPVIATTSPASQLGQVVSDRGLVTPPGDLDGFVEAINVLYSDAEQRNRLGQNARQYACEHLDRDRILSEFEKRLEELSSS